MASYSDDRELSWLKFNCRVLEEAEDDSVPLFERLGFVSIFSTNLDEFLAVRIGALCTRLEKKKGRSSVNAQIEAAADKLDMISKRCASAYRTVIGRFADHGVYHTTPETCSDADRAFLRNHFASEILPYLSPVTAEKKKQLFAENKTIYLLVKLRNTEGGVKYALVPAQSEFFKRVIFLSSDGRHGFVLAEDVIMHFAQLIFSDYSVCERALIRVTRSADIDMDAAYGYEDIEKATEKILEKREKLPPVRVQYSRGSSREFIESFAKSAGILCGGRFVCCCDTPLDYGFISAIGDKLSGCSELFYDRLTPRRSPMIEQNESVMKQIERKDRLLIYPYESMEPFLQLIDEAAEDNDVVSIKITLYRVASGSRLIDGLIRAARNGKDVTVVIELRARFDESANLMWSERLREAGVRVVHGLKGCKVHSKLLLIIKQNGNGISYITQVGTGNYNEKTAKRYTDLVVMTADSGIGADAFAVFNALSLGVLPSETRQLMIAPSCMKTRVIGFIDEQAALGAGGYIGMKMNALTDKDVIAHLVEASKRGAKIELIVRGASCLVAGIGGATENISLVSVVGSFLEHGRIYIFGRNDPNVFISSADMMTRNLEKRVEAALPIKDDDVKRRILDYFNVTFGDGVKARVQYSDGIYRRRQRTADSVNSQMYFYRQAYEAEKTQKDAKKSVVHGSEYNEQDSEKLSIWQRIKRFFNRKERQ